MHPITKIISGAAVITALFMLQSAVAAAPSTNAAGDIPVYSGGVGEDEMNYIKSVEHQYDLKLMFTEANGTFLADLPVTISKGGNTVVSTVTNGPILLVNLPAGTYNVTASDGGSSKEQKISVSPGSKRTYQFRFPTHPGDITEGKE